MRYDAFISYSHSDRPLAAAIQDNLYAFSKPWAELSELRLYRDDTHTAIGDDLKPSVIEALTESRFLILIASPHAAQSKWVKLEVKTFLATHSSKAILIVLASGTLVWDMQRLRFQPGSDLAFPELEEDMFKEEPVYLDLSVANDRQILSLADPRFRASIASLASVLRGVPKEKLVGNYITEQRNTRRGQRINLGFRGAVGFATWPVLVWVAAPQFLRHELESSSALLIAIVIFAGDGLLGAVTCGLCLRGAIGFAIGFALMIPAYAVARVSPFGGAWGDSAFLWSVCVLGFAFAGWVGAWIARRYVRDGIVAFAIGGIAAASLWLLFPELRDASLGTQLFGPWLGDRVMLLMAAAFNRSLLDHLVVLPIGAGVGGMIFGIQLADRAVDLGLKPSPSLLARSIKRIAPLQFRVTTAAIVVIGGVLWAASLTDWYQRRMSASRLSAATLGNAFSTLHVNYGYFDPDLFRLVLRARSDLAAFGGRDEAARFSALLGKLMSEYQGYPDLFPDDLDGLVDVAISFVQTGATDDLVRLLENAERNAGLPSATRKGNFGVPGGAGPLHYGFDHGEALLAVAGGWAVYGDRERFQTVLARAADAAKQDGKPLGAAFAAHEAVSLLSVGRHNEAEALLASVDFTGASIDLRTAVTLFEAKLWPERAKKPGGIQAIEFVRAHRGAEALAMFSTPGKIDLINESAAPVLSAAIDAGERDTAFRIFDVASQKAYRDIHTEPSLPLFQAMVEAAKKKGDRITLKRIVDELKTQSQQIESSNSSGYMDYDLGERMVKTLKILIAAGETEFAVRLADKSGQHNYEVYLAAAKSYLEAKRPRDAHGQIVRSWRSLYLDFGFVDHADGPIDRFAELLIQTRDLRGARFVADDYGVHPYGAAKLAKQMTLYCAILEASTGWPGERSGAAFSTHRSH